MRNEVSKAVWFAAVSSTTGHWDRTGENTLILWFTGYKPAEMHTAELELMKLGGFCLDQKFDSHCGKTAMIIREPKRLVE